MLPSYSFMYSPLGNLQGGYYKALITEEGAEAWKGEPLAMEEAKGRQTPNPHSDPRRQGCSGASLRCGLPVRGSEPDRCLRAR